MIIHVGPSNLQLPARLGGAIERRMLELAAAQMRAGQSVMVYSRAGETGWGDCHGVRIRYLDASRAEFPLRFLQDAGHRGARVIHVHNRAEMVWLVKAAGVAPVVLSCDYHLEPWHRLPVRALSKVVWRRCLLACDHIAPVSAYCRELHRKCWQLPEERLTIIPNGVDCARFRPDGALRAEWRERLGMDDRPVILYVGRLCEQKGTDLLIAAYGMLRRRAALIAAGPCERFGNAQVSALAAALCDAGGKYLPPVDDADLPGLYNCCDIFVMPTRELEMFGMAAVEAQACGKPVVASDHGGLCETVPESAGVRFPPGDAAALARSLESLLDSSRTCDALAQGARENAARYDWPRVAERCEEVYTEVARTRQVAVSSYCAN
jgi:glycosyltransferase involved in cell wall biosynthesis